MSRVLRGVWSRRGALTALVLMSVVVVGGAVTVLQFAEAADTSRWLTAPLLLIGAVAVPSIGAELAVARRAERRLVSVVANGRSLRPIIGQYVNRVSDLLWLMARDAGRPVPAQEK